MQQNWKMLAALVLGVIIGLAWKPYTIQVHSDPQIVIRINHVTGNAWIFLPNDQWRRIKSD